MTADQIVEDQKLGFLIALIVFGGAFALDWVKQKWHERQARRFDDRETL